MKRCTFSLSLLLTSIASIAFANKEKITADQKDELFKKVKNRTYIWGFGETIYSEDFKLDRSGTIKGYSHENEQYWKIDDYGHLIILNAGKKVQWTFTRQEDKNGQLYFVEPGGRYLLED